MIWKDGICKTCGSMIYEQPCDYNPTIPETKYSDYMNMCSNDECEHHVWHYVDDMEELDYYTHKMGKTL